VSENQTWIIDLGESWDNTSLNASSIPSQALGFNPTAFVENESQTLYSLDGEHTQAENPYTDHSLSYWTLDIQEPSDNESLGWVQTIIPLDGPNTTSLIIADPVGGTYTYDGQCAYYIGGYVTQFENDDGTHWNSSIVKNTGLLRFDLINKQLTNYTNDVDFLGPIFNVPFGQSGSLISLGGSTSLYAEHGPMWSNITIFDKATNRSYHQFTTGEIPDLGSSVTLSEYTFFSGIDEKHGTFEL
jgi:hypothetical protein